MHDRDRAAAVAVRVGVALDRGPVGRPPRMADAGGHVSGRVGGSLPEGLERMPAHGVAPAPQAVVVDEDDAC